MSVASALLPPDHSTATSDRIVEIAASSTVAYLAVACWPMWLHHRMTGDWWPLIGHLVTLSLGIVAIAGRGGLARTSRDWLPLLAGPFMYIELRWIIAALRAPHHDGLVAAWEASLFPGNPSATLARSLPVRALSEALHFAYASYYLLVYLPPALLYLRAYRPQFARTMLALTIVYGACFVTYACFPVDGPRYLVGAASAPDGPVRAFVLRLLEQGSSRGTAFPSSHIAASVVSALCALQFQRRVGVVVAILSVALAIATVYGGFHYAVDGLAGVMLGILAWLASNAVWRAVASRGVHSATAH